MVVVVKSDGRETADDEAQRRSFVRHGVSMPQVAV